MLRFPSVIFRDEFFRLLKTFIEVHKIVMNPSDQLTVKEILSMAQTKAARQKLLETFFRTVFAHVSCSLQYRYHEDASKCDIGS